MLNNLVKNVRVLPDLIKELKHAVQSHGNLVVIWQNGNGNRRNNVLKDKVRLQARIEKVETAKGNNILEQLLRIPIALGNVLLHVNISNNKVLSSAKRVIPHLFENNLRE